MGKPGKYAHIVAKLPRSYGSIDEDPSSNEKIAAVKAAILKEPSPDDEDAGKEKSPELSDEAIEDLALEVTAMLKVINDNLIRPLAGRRQASSVAKMYRGVRRIRDVMKGQDSTTKIIKAAYEQILVDQYEAEGMTSLALDDMIGGSVRYELQPNGSVKDKDKNRQWALENGYERDLNLGWQKVNALTKDLLLKGEDAPDGVEVTARVKVVYTK